MAVWTREINTDYSFPKIDILNVFKDGVLSRYEAVPHENYVMYDTTDQIFEPQRDENGNFVLDEEGLPVQVPVTYYYTIALLPLGFDFSNFTWKSELRANVDEKYIF